MIALGGLLLAFALQSTLVLGGALVTCAVAKRLSAEERHLILTTALASLVLVLPATLLLPKAALPVGGAVAESWDRLADGLVFAQQVGEPADRGASGSRVAADTTPAAASPQAEMAAARESDARMTAPDAAANRGRTLATVAWLYAAVAGAIGAYLVGCLIYVARRLGGIERVSDSATSALVEDVARELGVRRRVALHQSRTDRTPWTWGFVRPAVVLPREFESWSAQEQRAAVIHELSHVKRRDLWSLTLAHACCALYWFQPLVWIAARRMKREAEHACDDRVMLSGVSTSAYAGQLLGIANAIFRDARRPAALVPAMAGTSFVSGRIKSILDDRTRRRTVNTRHTIGALVAMLLISVPLATLESQPAMPADEAELERRVEALLEQGRTAEARDLLVRWIPTNEPCGICVRGLDSESSELGSLVADAFDALEERAHERGDGNLLARLAQIYLRSDHSRTTELGLHYVIQAHSVGNLGDEGRLLSVNYLSELGQYSAAQAIAEKLHNDPASRYHESDLTQSWIDYLESTQSRFARISTHLLEGTARDGDSEYAPVFKPAPGYPEQALTQELEGYVIAEYTITPNGKTTNARIEESSSGLFEDAALASVRDYRYLPRTSGGVPVAVHGAQTMIRFELEQ